MGNQVAHSLALNPQIRSVPIVPATEIAVMGILGPLEETIDDNVPATPPDLQDLQAEDNSEDDLFAETKETDKTSVFIYNNDLSFKHIIPIMPSKGEYEDILGLEPQNYPSWGVQSPPQKKKKNFCSKCVEEVKRDLKKLAKVIENYKNERDVARAENESLKKEVEVLKKILKQKEEKNVEVGVKVSIDNLDKENIDVLVKRDNFRNSPNAINYRTTKQDFGVNSFSISLQKQDVSPLTDLETEVQPKIKKTVADLRREFFAQEFKSEQKSFTSQNYLEIKPEEKKETVKSRLTIKIKPKNKITEMISKITSKFGHSKIIPEVPPITLFQRFEKTRDVWRNDLEVNNCA